MSPHLGTFFSSEILLDSKIIVGLALVDIKEIGEFLNRRPSTLAISLGRDDSFALALIGDFFRDRVHPRGPSYQTLSILDVFK